MSLKQRQKSVISCHWQFTAVATAEPLVSIAEKLHLPDFYQAPRMLLLHHNQPFPSAISISHFLSIFVAGRKACWWV